MSSCASALTLQLSAKSAQDVPLTCAPKCTFFRKLYCPHTNFAQGQVEQTIGNGGSTASLIGAGANQPRRVSTTLQRTVDLVGMMYVRTVLPALNTRANTGLGGDTAGPGPGGNATLINNGVAANVFTSTTVPAFAAPATDGYAYVDEVGTFMVGRAERTIGGHTIDELHAEHQYLEWHAERTDENLLTRSLGIGTDAQRRAYAFNEQVIYSPLQFWHTKYPSLYLPHIAIQGHEDVLFIDGRAARDLWGGFGAQEVVVDANFAAINTALTQAAQELVYDGVFLDRAERMMMARVLLEHLITEHQEFESLNQGAASNTIRLQSLPFNHPTRDIMIALRRVSRLGTNMDNTIPTDLMYPVRTGTANPQIKSPLMWNDFSGGLMGATGERTLPLAQLQMRINNYERFCIANPIGEYYNEVHPSQKFCGRTRDTFGQYYAFGQYGQGVHPSGTINFSAIDQMDLTLTRLANPMSTYVVTAGGAAVAPYRPQDIDFEAVDVFVYTRNVNVLKFVSGMVGKAYAN